MRVVIAEDEVLLRELIAAAVVPYGIQVVSRAESEPELLAAVAATTPDLVLTDISMPAHDLDAGLRAAKKIRDTQPAIGVILLTRHGEVTYATELLEKLTHSVGYYRKSNIKDCDELVPVMRRVVAGEVVIDPEIVTMLFNRRRVVNPLDKLTPHERRILELVVQGYKNAVIARIIGTITEAAIEAALTKIYRKLEIRPSAEISSRILAVVAFLQHTGHRPPPQSPPGAG